MAGRQLTGPLLIRGNEATPLIRVSFDERFKDEDWLQEMLFRHPQLLPVHEFEPVFDELIPLAREVPVASGFVDLLYVNSSGFLTIVETKLWRNPEARRSVITQLMDYAKDISKWSYDDVVAAIKAPSSGGGADPLLALVHQQDPNVSDTVFTDAIARNLRLGRFLLLVVGDGIQEGVEHLVEFFQQTPQLQYTLGLVEIGLYRMTAGSDDPLLVQPRIVARTREVTRAIVEVRNASSAEVRVVLPAQETVSAGNKQTEDEFMRRLGQLGKPEMVEAARWILSNAPKHRLETFWGKRSFSLYFPDESGYSFSTSTMTVTFHFTCCMISAKNLGYPMRFGSAITTPWLDWCPVPSGRR